MHLKKLPLFFMLLAGVVLLTGLTACHHESAFYLSPTGNDTTGQGTLDKPWKTPGHTQQVVRTFLKDHPKKKVTVYLREGTYYLNHPLVFQPDDGGNPNRSVSWSACRDESVTLSGGTELTGWKTGENGLWTLQLQPDLNFEQLYVNGQLAVRARIPNTGDPQPRWYLRDIIPLKSHGNNSIQKIIIRLDDTRQTSSLAGPVRNCEFVLFKDWAILRKQVFEADLDRGQIIMKPPFALSEANYNSLFAAAGRKYSGFLEGHPAFIDQPGEWAIDPETHILYYQPQPGQTPENTRIIAPLIKTLIHIKGSRRAPVQNLHFTGISFSHAAYLLPPYGHDGRQACFFYTGSTGLSNDQALIENAVSLTWASQCSFENCHINQTGSNAIYFSEGCHHNRMSHCTITDFGGNGIMIGTAYDPVTDTLALPTDNEVADCSIHSGGRHFQSAVGIWLGFTSGCRIIRNEIFNMPYTGISVGWQWNPKPSSASDNLILDNQIHDVMRMLGDGGGIYTLGYQPGTVIKGNKIHDILRSELNHASPNNGMFIDEGSKGYLIEDNLIYHTAHTCIRGHRAAGVTLKNNTFVYDDLPAISHTPPYDRMILVNKDTTVTWANPGWPAAWGYPDKITAFFMEGNRYIPADEFRK